MTELTRTEAPSEMTMWATRTLWVPFVEDENANITGPGHQDKAVFAAAVENYDFIMSGLPSIIPVDDVAHRWVVAQADEDGEWSCSAVPAETPGAIPVTTVWGVR